MKLNLEINLQERTRCKERCKNRFPQWPQTQHEHGVQLHCSREPNFSGPRSNSAPATCQIQADKLCWAAESCSTLVHVWKQQSPGDAVSLELCCFNICPSVSTWCYVLLCRSTSTAKASSDVSTMFPCSSTNVFSAAFLQCQSGTHNLLFSCRSF